MSDTLQASVLHILYQLIPVGHHRKSLEWVNLRQVPQVPVHVAFPLTRYSPYANPRLGNVSPVSHLVDGFHHWLKSGRDGSTFRVSPPVAYMLLGPTSIEMEENMAKRVSSKICIGLDALQEREKSKAKEGTIVRRIAAVGALHDKATSMMVIGAVATG